MDIESSSVSANAINESKIVEMDEKLRLVLLHPVFLSMLDFPTLSVDMKLLNKTIYDSLSKRSEEGFWNAMCISFTKHAGLFSPYLSQLEGARPELSGQFAHQHFLNDLWIARKKWSKSDLIEGHEAGENEEGDSQVDQEKDVGEFKIAVTARFRPGQIVKENMNLPLHQFLKLKRQERLKNAYTNDEHFVGENDPEEFLDPFLNVLMREPVLLLSSNRICERALAVQSILRSGRDPFNHAKLSMEQVIPQLELKENIETWKLTKQANTLEQLSISDTQVKANLIDSKPDIDPELLNALLEAEQMMNLADKTKIMSNRKRHTSFGDMSFDMDAAVDEALKTDAENNNENIDQNSINENMNSNDSNIIVDENDSEDVLLSNLKHGSLESDGLSKVKEGARVLDVNEDKSAVSMHVPGIGVRSFDFTNVFDGHTSQSNLYEKGVRQSITHLLNGFNACALCYGQTGSGKTHTFFGPTDILTEVNDVYNDKQGIFESSIDLPRDSGMALRAGLDLLLAKERMSRRDIEMTITIQYIEIYDEECVDLMTGEAVQISRATGEVPRAIMTPLNTFNELIEILRVGQTRKRFATTAMNDRSSRSHTALIVHVTQVYHDVHHKSLQSPNQEHEHENDNDNEAKMKSGNRMIKSVLQLVDLAGSERVKRSKVEGQNLIEAIAINQSLMILGRCISGLVEKKTHIPYLESKLTTLLRAAFGGNCMTTTIICNRSDKEHGDETLQTLRFGERCSMISNNIKTTATSAEATLATLDAALKRVTRQVTSMKGRGKDHLESYTKLVSSMTSLTTKRNHLADMLSRKAKRENILQNINSKSIHIRHSTKALVGSHGVGDGINLQDLEI